MAKWIHSWDFNELRKQREESGKIEYLPNYAIKHDGEEVTINDDIPKGMGFLPESDVRVATAMKKRRDRLERERQMKAQRFH